MGMMGMHIAHHGDMCVYSTIGIYTCHTYCFDILEPFRHVSIIIGFVLVSIMPFVRGCPYCPTHCDVCVYDCTGTHTENIIVTCVS